MREKRGTLLIHNCCLGSQWRVKSSVGDRGVARNLLRGTKEGVWETVRVPGQSPGGGLGAKPPEAEAEDKC